jgi:hypothetical protein
LIPHEIDNDSGVGTQVTAGDVNKDGKQDVIVGNKKGVFVSCRSEREREYVKLLACFPMPSERIESKPASRLILALRVLQQHITRLKRVAAQEVGGRKRLPPSIWTSSRLSRPLPQLTTMPLASALTMVPGAGQASACSG